MATLDTLPSADVVLSLKGTLDFYIWRGIPCVRTWPRKPRHPRAPGVAAAGQAFAAFSRDVQQAPTELLDAARLYTTGTLWTWKDATTAAAYGHLNYTAP
jgi:hypothetical protein